MASKILITRMARTLANGDVAGVKASMTTASGKTFTWSGKLGDGSVYEGGKIEDGDSIIQVNSDGPFAFTLLKDAEPTPPPAPKKRAPRKPPADKTSEIGKVRESRNARKQ